MWKFIKNGSAPFPAMQNTASPIAILPGKRLEPRPEDADFGADHLIRFA